MSFRGAIIRQIQATPANRHITQVWARGRTDDALFRTVRNGAPDTEMSAFAAPRTSDLDVWRKPAVAAHPLAATAATAATSTPTH